MLRRLFDIEITKVYSIWKYRQSCWAKSFIDNVSTRRAEVSDELERDCLKLTMNGNYGKLLQNQLEQSAIDLYTDPEAWQRAVWRKNFKESDIVCFDEERGEFLAWVKHKKKKAVLIDTLRFQGLAVLEWSKMLMLELHYDVMKKHFDDAAQLCFTDTDSFIYNVTLTPRILSTYNLEDAEHVTAYDLLNAVNAQKPVFDLSKCDDKVLKRKCPFKGRIGFAKLEVGYDKQGVWQSLVGFLGAQAKMYALMIKQQCEDRVVADMNEIVAMKAKGLPSKMLKKTFDWDDYEKAIFQNVVRKINYRMMRSRGHVVEHLDTCKIGITSNNDKIFMRGPNAYNCLGHFRNYLPGAADEDADLWKIES
jgi:hypothetical protein